MASRLEDRWLWLGLGVFFFVAAKGIKYALTDIVRLTELDPAQYPANDKHYNKHPEELIDVKTLKTLCMSPNPSIAAAARSLVIRRFAALPDAAEILNNDRESEDPEISRKATQAVKYLRDFDMQFGESLLPEQYEHDHAEELIAQLEREHGADVIYRTADGEAAIMHESEWDTMARELNRRQDHFDEERGMDVVARLEELSEEIARTEQEMGALQARMGWDRVEMPGGSSRPPAYRGEARRRRHREAMVLHEGDGILEEEDIIRPSASRMP